jgi:PAS domain S-box-containing protein
MGNLAESRTKRAKKPASSPILQSIFDGISDGILVIDKDFKVVMFNKAMQGFMRKPAEEIDGRHCYYLCHSTEYVCDDCCAESVFANSMPPSRIRVCFRDNMKRKFEIWNFPIYGKDGSVDYMIEYIKDVTDRQKMEKELTQARRLAIIGEVAAKTAHEIRNPLNAMEGAAHYLLEEYGSDPKLQKYLGLIKDQISRLNNVATELLKDARTQPAFGEKAYINSALLKSIEVVGSDIRDKNIAMEVYLDEKLPKLTFDENKMQQVFINLLRNSTDAIDAKQTGNIEIVGHLKQVKGDDYVEISIMDNGAGLPKSEWSRAFESFYTTKKNGTGLGLSIVKDIMKSHGGYVYMESGSLGGACVCVGLPCNEQ